MKRLVALLLVLLLMCSCALADFENEELEAATLEGQGFNSLEEAVEAYVIAFNHGDAASMLSTFAIETYVDNFDTQKFIERLRAVSPSHLQCLPSANDYIRGIQIAYRYGSLANNLFYQYLQYNTPEEYADLASGRPIVMHEDGAAEAFVNAMSDVPMEKWFGKIELTRFLSIEELAEIIQNDSLSEKYYREANQNNIQRIAACYGCDELVDIPVLLKIDGTDYLLFMWCARYGDTWYNLDLGGNVSNILGLSTYMGGLVPLESLIEE